MKFGVKLDLGLKKINFGVVKNNVHSKSEKKLIILNIIILKISILISLNEINGRKKCFL
jgi:hypothetical protein